MKTNTQIAIIVAIPLFLTGLCLMILGFSKVGLDLNKVSSDVSETCEHKISGDFERISVDVSISNIEILPSDDDTCKVVCLEGEKLKHQVENIDRTLTITDIDNRKWYDHKGFFIADRRVTVYLPKSEYSKLEVSTHTGSIKIADGFTFNDISLKSSTGHINCNATALECLGVKSNTGYVSLESVNAGKTIDIETSTGKIRLTDVTCEALTLQSSTGSISLENTVCAKDLRIESSTGHVRLDAADADSVFINTSTGSVTGTLLSDKIFITSTSTGKVSVPETTSGGQCRIKTSTGNINIKIQQ